MSLKDELKKTTKESQISIGENAMIEKHNKQTKDDKRSREWAQNMIKDLPERMKEVAKEGKSEIIVPCTCGDKIGRVMLGIVNEWAKEQDFKTEIKHKVATMASYRFDDQLIIRWE